MRAFVAAAALAGAAVVAAPTAVAEDHAGAGAGTDSRAAVVVDLGGGEVRTACVLFRGPSVSGLDLLRAADMQPVVRAYAGEGGAVCKLCGVGCSAGGDCLTCQAPRYWQYWRSQGGPYEYSQRGAGASEVTDGDVEGWTWSAERRPPPARTVESVCEAGPVFRVAAGPAPATTTTAAPAPPTTAAGPPPAPGLVPTTTPARAAAPRPTAGGAPAGTPLTSMAPATAPEAALAAPATTVASTTTAALAAPPRGRAEPPAAPQGSSAAGFAAFGAVLATLVGAGVRARRRRTNMPPGPPTG